MANWLRRNRGKLQFWQSVNSRGAVAGSESRRDLFDAAASRISSRFREAEKEREKEGFSHQHE